mmetsp:Transcript_120961/g.342689  ORF Transcript_120961/g.342689 Transcript_120961/m.342689 type:complete len:244 (-) Transcript_120961:35-766(-)
MAEPHEIGVGKWFAQQLQVGEGVPRPVGELLLRALPEDQCSKDVRHLEVAGLDPSHVAHEVHLLNAHHLCKAGHQSPELPKVELKILAPGSGPRFVCVRISLGCGELSTEMRCGRLFGWVVDDQPANAQDKLRCDFRWLGVWTLRSGPLRVVRTTIAALQALRDSSSESRAQARFTGRSDELKDLVELQPPVDSHHVPKLINTGERLLRKMGHPAPIRRRGPALVPAPWHSEGRRPLARLLHR